MTAWAWAALVLYAVWTLAAFGVRAVIQRRRTGDAGFRGISGRPGSVQWWAGVLFVAALIGGAAAPVASLLGMPVLPGGRAVVVHVAGTALVLAGMATTLVAQSAMGASWRVGVDERERTSLVTGGLFAHVRNPVFTAMGITAAGLALMVPNPLAFGALVALMVAIELQVRVVEEPYLAALHGSAYLEYTAGVGRFVPSVGRGSVRATSLG